MSGILKSWIRNKVWQLLSLMAENPVRIAQNQRVQVMRVGLVNVSNQTGLKRKQFLTYENPVFAEVSDMETFICCEFTQECVEEYQAEFGKRFTQIKGAYLTLKNMRLQIYGGQNFTVSARLVVPKIQFLGGEGEAIVGHPIFFTEHQEIRVLLKSPRVQGFLWPPLSVEQASEEANISFETETFARENNSPDELIDTSVLTDDVKKRGFWSTYSIKDEWNKREKKKKRVLHPGWRGLSEITYQDCIISDEQQKILEQDDSWYPPINTSQKVFMSDNIPNTLEIEKKTIYSPDYKENKLNSPTESTFSWEESPILNKSSSSTLGMKINEEKTFFYMEKKDFFSDNDTPPPSSSSPVIYSPLLQTSIKNNSLKINKKKDDF
ncbi:hypothetical protein PORY_000179 [Pneumocystis oryctolagi]|uniref:Uncharacterized protein n=1 Tax=Pneumocystis oryctolagi TaxID=42067 RepID=A0ACB7CF34_9ASCO|nr:hypothetical protein PORY_000179 [Pneumocystis oryctolagi]